MTGIDHTRPAKPADKVSFELEEDWHGYAREMMWAEKIRDERYRLLNSPFFAFGVSAYDIIQTGHDGTGMKFVRVLFRSGHSTYRIITQSGLDDKFKRYWGPVQQLGCTFEQGPGKLIAVDVPPEADIYSVYDLLKKGEADGAWDFEEGHCGHSLAE